MMFGFVFPLVSSIPAKVELHPGGIQEHHNLPTREQASEAIQNVKMPSGISLTGNMEPVKKVATSSKQEPNDSDSTDEQFLGDIWGGWGGWGGFGGFGPWRFGFSCGGLGGWAYPLGYWNAFGVGLYGGGCGLGFAWQSLYFC